MDRTSRSVTVVPDAAETLPDMQNVNPKTRVDSRADVSAKPLPSFAPSSEHQARIMTQSYRVCVYGAGGVGGYLAARLSQKGIEVSVVARGEHLKAMKVR